MQILNDVAVEDARLIFEECKVLMNDVGCGLTSIVCLQMMSSGGLAEITDDAECCVISACSMSCHSLLM